MSGDIVKVNDEIITKVIWDKDYLGYFLYANEENSIDSFENGEQPLYDYFGSIEVIRKHIRKSRVIRRRIEMLKIKDTVDLVELEKIGFKRQPNNYIYSLFNTEIIVDIKDKTIDTLTLRKKYECTELLARENTTMEELKCFLPELIDLVEEVKEEIKC